MPPRRLDDSGTRSARVLRDRFSASELFVRGLICIGVLLGEHRTAEQKGA